MDKNEQLSRRGFVAGSAAAGTVAALAGTVPAFAKGKKKAADGKVRARAAFDASGELKPFEFERRPMGDDDIVIDIKFASVCHSDIHQERGDWGPQQYPQVPGHEIVGIVSAVGGVVNPAVSGVLKPVVKDMGEIALDHPAVDATLGSILRALRAEAAAAAQQLGCHDLAPTRVHGEHLGRARVKG